MDCQLVTQGELAEQYVSGKIDPALQDEFEIHILECRECARLVEVCEETRIGLVAQQDAIRAGLGKMEWSFSSMWGTTRSGYRWAVSTVLVLVLAVAAGIGIRWRHSAQESAGGSRQGAQTESNQTGTAPAFAHDIAKAPTPISAAALSQQTISNRQLHSLDSRAIAAKDNVSAKLNRPSSAFSYLNPRSRKIVLAAINSRGNAVVALANSAGAKNLFAKGSDNLLLLVSPVEPVVLSRTPTFHWNVYEGAELLYRVRIYDAERHLLATSAPMGSTSWTADFALERGKTYAWTVLVRGKERDFWIDPPQAFKILDQVEYDELEGLERNYPDEHFIPGVLMAYYGLLEDAVRELSRVPKSDAHYFLAVRLLTTLAPSNPPNGTKE